MQLRVRSLDGAELVLAVPPLTVRVQVADVKRRALSELRRLRETARLPDDAARDAESDACLAFRGQLLADVDDVNLFALTPSDFFVLIEEEAQDGEEEDEDSTGSGDEETKSSERRKPTVSKMHRQAPKIGGVEPGLAEATVLQLVEMGFQADQAREAAELARGELARAIALLTGEVDASTVFGASGNSIASHSSRLGAYVDELIRRYPELAAIESLLQNEQVHTLKRIATRSEFEALVMLKETFPAHWLAQMNENPSATALFLALPDQFESAGIKSRKSTARSPKKAKPTNMEVDLTDDPMTGGETVLTTPQLEAIERLTAMGFASDLVVAIYESCGGNEELAANLLFETLQ